MEKNKLLKNLQMYSFILVDTALFLDTHPRDKKALEYYAKMQEKFKAAKKEYTEKYGPLSIMDANPKQEKWEWVKGPWPWEAAANVELR